MDQSGELDAEMRDMVGKVQYLAVHIGIYVCRCIYILFLYVCICMYACACRSVCMWRKYP